MKAPYFKGQESEKCGCYYPDVILLDIDITARTRTLHCVVHGKYVFSLSDNYCGNNVSNKMPSDEWREEKRQELWHSQIFSERRK